jgi:hypothetical protein
MHLKEKYYEKLTKKYKAIISQYDNLSNGACCEELLPQYACTKILFDELSYWEYSSRIGDLIISSIWRIFTIVFSG